MARTQPAGEPVRSNSLVTVAIIVAALYFGREILLPFGLAILLSFLLAPLVDRLESWGSGRITSVLGVVSLVGIGVALLTFMLAQQVYNLAYRLPEYKDNIIAKVEVFQGHGEGVWDRVSRTVEDLRKGMEKEEQEAEPEPETPKSTIDVIQEQLGIESSESEEKGETLKPDRENPLPVEVVETLSAAEVAQSVMGPILAPLAAAGLVTIFVIFMLLNREDLRNRFIHLIGDEQIHVTTQALDDAAARVSRYLLMQLVINASYGFVIFVGLSAIGLPNALLWGVMTTVLRFIPYVGPWIAAVMPIAVSLAVSEDWTTPGLVIVLFILNELVSNNVIEPWLYGSSTGISTIGILASAVFWAWIWGPVGLVMATPLTVCLTVMGRYIPQLAFLNTMLSDENVLPPHSSYYQRLLAQDPEEAMEIAEEYLAGSTLAELFEVVFIPALVYAEQDRQRDRLDDSRYAYVVQSTREIIEEIAERTPTAPDEEQDDGEPESVPVPVTTEISLLCVPASSEGDEVAGLMLGHLLQQRGVRAVVGSRHALSGEIVERITNEEIPLVCISSLPPLAATHARRMCKRLRPKLPDLKIVAGVWQASGITKKSQERLAETGVTKVVLTLEEAAESLEQIVRSAQLVQQAGQETPDNPPAATQQPANEKAPPVG